MTDAGREDRFARRMRLAAPIVLAVGLGAAALVYALVPADAPLDEATAAIRESRQYQLAVERIGGKAAVFAAEFNDWLASLWHGRRLAGTLALLSIALSGFCYLLGRPPHR